MRCCQRNTTQYELNKRRKWYTATMHKKRAKGLPDKEGGVREYANKSPKITDQSARNRLTLCVYALCQLPSVETLCGLSHRCSTPIQQHDFITVAQIAQLVAVYQYGRKRHEFHAGTRLMVDA